MTVEKSENNAQKPLTRGIIYAAVVCLITLGLIIYLGAVINPSADAYLKKNEKAAEMSEETDDFAGMGLSQAELEGKTPEEKARIERDVQIYLGRTEDKDGKTREATPEERANAYLRVNRVELKKPKEDIVSHFVRKSPAELRNNKTISLEEIKHKPFSKKEELTTESVEALIIKKLGYTIKSNK